MGILDRFTLSKSRIAHSAFRFIQMVLALAVVGLYAQDLKRANKAGKYSDGKWVCLCNPPSLFPLIKACPSRCDFSQTKPSAGFRCAQRSRSMLMLKIGVRNSNIIARRCHSARIPHPLHDSRSLPFRLGYDPLHTVDRGVWVVWEHVHQGEPRRQWGHQEDEECCGMFSSSTTFLAGEGIYVGL